MKYLILFFCSFLIYKEGFAQRNLSGSLHTSAETYIYRLHPKEAETLSRSNLDKIGDMYLKQLVDSFKTGGKTPPLVPGNYLFMWASGNRMVYQLHHVGDLTAQLISNDHDIAVIVHTAKGLFIPDAFVYLDGKQLAFNQKLQAYGPVIKKKPELIKVLYQDVLYTFPAEPVNQWYNRKVSFWSRVARSFPLKYVVQPIQKWTKKTYHYENYFYGPIPYERKFRSFMVFSKPKYKPGDTVKLKAFVQTAKGNPVKSSLLLRLSDRGFNKDSIIADLKPYRPGGFQYQFVLSDSMDLDLDEHYLLTLEEERSRKYNLSSYDGDMDEDDYALKRNVVAHGKFKYEDYELQSISFSARADRKEHSRGDVLSVFLKAVDENDLAVPDGRVQILVQPNVSEQTTFHRQKVFLPDTLWYHTQTLENLGETKITIPDSIFPSASFNYQIQCTFLNTDNERQTQTLSATYRDENGIPSIEPKDDSLKIDYKVKGQSISMKAWVIFYNDLDTLGQMNMILPVMIKINPFATHYEVLADGSKGSFELQPSGAAINCLTSRTKDSIAIQLVNPKHIPVWYTIFAGKKIVLRGSGNSLEYLDKVQTPKNYFVSLQYLYAGKVRRENYTIPFKAKQLHVQVDQPEFIYPGQTAKINIQVTDANGNPVPDADITAYSYTKKFGAPAPFIPYLGKIYPLRRRLPLFELNKGEEEQTAIWLNWQRWSREMDLDTIEYYRFLHPGTIYRNEEQVKDSLTQLAPFVVIKGELQPIHLLYIDEKPVFFSQAQQLQRYSFPLTAGKHSLRLRTQNRLVRIDSVMFGKGVKTFISINADTSNHDPNIHVEKMPDSLTTYEQNLWSRYMILLENNYGQNIAYIRQEDRFYRLPIPNSTYPRQTLAGPFTTWPARLVVKNNFEQEFIPEGGWQFTIFPGLIKQKQWQNTLNFHKRLSPVAPVYDFRDLVLTANEMDSIWQDYVDNRSYNEDLFYNESVNRYGNGKLQIRIPQKKLDPQLFIKNILLFRYDNPDFLRVYKGSTTYLGFVQPGTYRLFFLLKGNRYFIQDSITVHRDGINYYEINLIIEKNEDSVSRKISKVLERRSSYSRFANSASDLDQIKASFQEQYFDASFLTSTVNGVVVDEKGNPVYAATVAVKGTQITTVTDFNGAFILRTPPHGKLIFSAVGYTSRELGIMNGNDYRVVLKASVNALNEVVVVGYGISRRSELTGSVALVSSDNMLAGKVPGLMIRGAASSGSEVPMIIVDGLPFSGRMEDLNKNEINSINILKGAEATAIYGARAAAGVIVISTKKQVTPASDGLPAGNSLRRNFRDEAYWQPMLQTDEKGQAGFQVTFPDDITSWKTYVLVAGPKKQTGFSEGAIRSFKALSGNIALPQFAIEGDSIHMIGKTLNYLPDSVEVKRSFYINDHLAKESMIKLRNSWIDTFTVVPIKADSIRLKYTVQKRDGYFDGEERTISVLRQGVLETNGIFAALYRDTSFTMAPITDTGKIKIIAVASLLPVLYEEAESIRNYEYLCNEQLASKLKALLVEKRADQYFQRPFTKEKNIKEIIGLLNQNKASTGLWGWWPGDEPSLWISLHVAEALTDAQKNGYSVNLNKIVLTDYLVYNLESYNSSDKLSALLLLRKIEAKVDFKKYIDSLESRQKKTSLYEVLRLTELKQQLGMHVSLDSFLLKQNQTALGNVYWGEDEYNIWANAIQNTLSMYRLLRSTGGYAEQLQKIRGYFMEKRRTGHWRNTYESSLILECILPDLLAEHVTSSKTSLVIQGSTSVSVSDFPFAIEMRGGERLKIVKQGGMPVYFTAFEQHWNKAPEQLTGNFSVQSWFERNDQPVTVLKAGEVVTMHVKVSVKADADFVMVEIPVPAGCSYQNKRQFYSNNEVHREYFKNKVSIFCKSLDKGTYEFEVSLLPRYSGIYTLNPAKAEMMYFPVFNGRNSIRKVTIK